MKRWLPTLGSGSAPVAGAAFLPPVARVDPGRPIVAIADLGRGPAQLTLAAGLIAGLAKHAVPVAAWLSDDELHAASHAEAALASLRRAGAPHVALLRPSISEPHAALAEALAKLPAGALVVAVGIPIPLYYRTFFSLVVSTRRRPLTAAAQALARDADLLLPMAAESLVVELGRLLGARFSALSNA